MRAVLPVLFATLLAACGDSATTSPTTVDDATTDVTMAEDVVAPTDTSVGEDTTAVEETTGTDAPAKEAAADAVTDTGTPTCTPAGKACSTSGPCCPGNKCIDGMCRGCVSKGGFCTREAADRCCSGSCDGDSCNGFKVGEPCSSSSQCQLNNCVAGVCACAIGDAPCGTAGACVDIENNDAHCGACGKACGPSQRCLSGKCECRDTFTTNCGADCFDLRVEEAHCGACGKTCRSDQLCRLSACECATGSECAGACVFFSTDANNCGTCGNKCPTERPRCNAGTCACAVGLTQCSTGCKDLRTDRTNCGTCGNTCAGMKLCVAGVCS